MSYQGEPTEIELTARREPLETSAALSMGLLLFAFSRLEGNLRLFLDAVDPGHAAPRDDTEWPLERLMMFVDRQTDATLRASLRQWIVRAHRLEALRAALATGRWLPDRRSGCVVHETSDGRTGYTLAELAAALEVLKELEAALHGLGNVGRDAPPARPDPFLSTQPITRADTRAAEPVA